MILGQEIVALLAEPIVRLITVDTHSCHQYLLPMLHRSNGKNLSTKETQVVSQECPKFLGVLVICGSQRVNPSKNRVFESTSYWEGVPN